MTKTSKRIVFFGNEQIATGIRASCAVFKALLADEYTICALILSARDTSKMPDIARIARAANIPIMNPVRLRDALSDIADLRAEAGVLAAYGQMVPDSIIQLFPAGIINLHPSLLPLHRGSTPIESAILGGDAATGVSIMSLVKAMDAGPVFAQQSMPLQGSEDKQLLADTLADMGASLLLETLPDILTSKRTPIPQDESQATYDERIQKSDGIITWTKPASQIEREIRAYKGWPGSKTNIAGKDVTIIEARADHASMLTLSAGECAYQNNRLYVGCGKGALEIVTLKPSGKKEMSSAAFLAGHKSLLKRLDRS